MYCILSVCTIPLYPCATYHWKVLSAKTFGCQIQMKCSDIWLPNGIHCQVWGWSMCSTLLLTPSGQGQVIGSAVEKLDYSTFTQRTAQFNRPAPQLKILAWRQGLFNKWINVLCPNLTLGESLLCVTVLYLCTLRRVLSFFIYWLFHCFWNICLHPKFEWK